MEACKYNNNNNDDDDDDNNNSAYRELVIATAFCETSLSLSLSATCEGKHLNTRFPIQELEMPMYLCAVVMFLSFCVN